nr:hypothetical protein [Gammaproteobacteria bacterium]
MMEKLIGVAVKLPSDLVWYFWDTRKYKWVDEPRQWMTSDMFLSSTREDCVYIKTTRQMIKIKRRRIPTENREYYACLSVQEHFDMFHHKPKFQSHLLDIDIDFSKEKFTCASLNIRTDK